MNTKALEQWLGKTETRHDHVTVPMAERMAATLDRDDPSSRWGDKLPIGWHSMLFRRIARRSMIGRDGHPKLGDFLPPMPLPRRMFAGRRTQFIADLALGDAVTCTSVITSITPKTSRSGQMIQSFCETRAAGVKAEDAAGPATRLRLRTDVLVGTWEALVIGQVDLALGVSGEHANPGGVELRPLAK